MTILAGGRRGKRRGMGKIVATLVTRQMLLHPGALIIAMAGRRRVIQLQSILLIGQPHGQVQ